MKRPLRAVKTNNWGVPIADATGRIVCTVPAHAEAEMVAAIIVESLNGRGWSALLRNQQRARDAWLFSKRVWKDACGVSHEA
jgi:hypothetical protein